MSRSVMITGGASGIGRALARRLADRGDRLTLADIDAEGLAAVQAELAPRAQAQGGDVSAVVLDVRNGDEVRAVVDRLADAQGGLDIIVNNAGIGTGGPVEELEFEHWQRVFDINLTGVMHGTAAAYPRMVAAGHGHIVNIASLAGLVPAPFLAPYCAAKHGVVGLSLSLAAEASGTGVAVTCVCPGFTETPILDSEGPADLSRTSMSGRGRVMAEALPGGVYEVEKLARDIERAIDKRTVILVTPTSARLLWLAARVAPRRGVMIAGRLARRTRAELAARLSATQGA